MRDSLIHFLSSHGIPVDLVVLIISMIPIFELRGGIPAGLLLEVTWWKAFLIAVLGNLIPIPFILLFLEPLSVWLRSRSRFADRFFDWLFTRTQRKTESSVLKYGLFFGLMIFVAIPLPATGGWTGSIAAFLLGMKNGQAFLAIAMGVLIAGIVVSILTYGTATVMSFL